MKLSHLSVMYAGFSAVLLSSTSMVFANPNEQKIEYKQKMLKEEMESSKKARPAVEGRPSDNTKKH